MLVLARKPGEQVVVDGDVRVTILEIRGGCVRLGFEAPLEVPIRRHEIAERDLVRHAAGADGGVKPKG